MSIDKETLAALFDPSRDAVLAVRSGELIYRNTSAAEILPDFDASHLAALMPSECGASTAVCNGIPLDITVSDLGDTRVYTLSPCVEAAPPAEFLPLMDQALKGLRTSLDELSALCRVERFASCDRCSAGAYRGYFRILRLYKHSQLMHALETGCAAYHPSRVSMNLLCGSICHTLNSLLGADRIRIDYSTDMKGECVASADEKLTELLILNLLTDSLLRLPEGGGLIRVTLAHQGSRIVLGIDDHAVSPAPELDSGLRLARVIAEYQGGGILLDNSDETTRVRVMLPAADTQSLIGFSSQELAYPQGGMDTLLTELSPFLGLEFYRQRYLD